MCSEGDVRGIEIGLGDNLREFVALLQHISLALCQLSLGRKEGGVHVEEDRRAMVAGDEKEIGTHLSVCKKAIHFLHALFHS